MLEKKSPLHAGGAEKTPAKSNSLDISVMDDQALEQLNPI